MKYLFFSISLVLLWACKGAVNPPTKTVVPVEQSTVLKNLNLPDGFKIDIYAEDIENARSMKFGDEGTLFVGNRGGDKVYALQDTDGDFKIDKKYIIHENATMPNGVAFKDGDLYVAELDRILKFSDIESKLENPGEPEIIFDDYPDKKHHGWKYIDFGPDGKLYVPVGAPCNICTSEDEVFATLTRMDPDGSNMEIVHQGIRNTVGFTWHPISKELWFTDNGGDMMGDDIPACELNRCKKDGLHFGYPYCHQGDLLDEEYGKNKSCSDYTAPVQNLMAHVAPLGVKFYTAEMFPKSYQNNVAFIAEHGSWNRSKKSGYKISMVRLDDEYKAISYETFLDGWLDEATQEVSGRPVDIEWMSDGSMLISDDFEDRIYRVTYEGEE